MKYELTNEILDKIAARHDFPPAKVPACIVCKDCKHGKKYWLADGLTSCTHPDKISPEGYMPIHSEQWTCECAEVKMRVLEE